MASVDAQFTSLMDDMQGFCDASEDYLRGVGTQREWMIPAGYTGGWEFQPHDIPNVGDPFTRDQANQPNDLYKKEYQGLGDQEVRTIMGTHVEIHYMAMMERAFRERHRLPTRAMIHLGARHKAHADANGVHKYGVEGYVQELFVA
jgi:hypothetical protein